jgi:CRP/FNR family transcriptional regulator, cyclic AMP receptor protein
MTLATTPFPTGTALVDALRRVPLFQGHDDAALARIAAAARPRRFGRNQVIFHRDDPGEVMYIVAAGTVRITVSSVNGESALLAVMRSGDFFGELALLDGGPRSATATTAEPVQLWALSREDALGPLLAVPGAAGMLAALAQRVRRCDELLEELYTLDLPARLARALLRLASEHGERCADGVHINVPLTQSDLAMMVGASRPRVNVALGTYQDAGLVRFTGRTVILTDVEALRSA